jgi:hypothetical protein
MFPRQIPVGLVQLFLDCRFCLLFRLVLLLLDFFGIGIRMKIHHVLCVELFQGLGYKLLCDFTALKGELVVSLEGK